MSEEVAIRESSELATQETMTLEQLTGQVQLIQQAMRAVMQDGVHFGVIPGTDKPTLYKPGAEKLCLLFRLDPQYEIHDSYDAEHYTVRATCVLYHSPTGNRMGSGEGLCTTKEKKYGIRSAQKLCPVCGKAAIIKGKAEYGGGWLCWKKKDGCGATFADDDKKITSQKTEDVLNPDVADTYNTVLKMACKRALVAGVLNVTAASDIFTQDMEDIREPAKPVEPLASKDTIDGLALMINQAAGTAPELWAEPVVCANASRRFGRQIDKLEDLRVSEAQMIENGLLTWSATQKEEMGDDDTEYLNPDEIEF